MRQLWLRSQDQKEMVLAVLDLKRMTSAGNAAGSDTGQTNAEPDQCAETTVTEGTTDEGATVETDTIDLHHHTDRGEEAGVTTRGMQKDGKVDVSCARLRDISRRIALKKVAVVIRGSRDTWIAEKKDLHMTTENVDPDTTQGVAHLFETGDPLRELMIESHHGETLVVHAIVAHPAVLQVMDVQLTTTAICEHFRTFSHTIG